MFLDVCGIGLDGRLTRDATSPVVNWWAGARGARIAVRGVMECLPSVLLFASPEINRPKVMVTGNRDTAHVIATGSGALVSVVVGFIGFMVVKRYRTCDAMRRRQAEHVQKSPNS